ncbi:membrane protein, partial [Streptomyces sp. NRRL WC-3618]
LPTPQPSPRDLPWGIAVLAAGLAVEAYATRAPHTHLTLPGGATGSSAAVLVGWTLTALGLALAGPGLAHLCGRLLQAVRPGALRLLAGRVLMEEATRIGRPLGVVCAVASGAYAMIVLYDHATDDPSLGPLTILGALVVAGCAVATLLTAAAEARHARADTTAALLRLGAPATTLRTAAGLRAAALLALFGPLTLLIAELAALPLTA